MDQKNYQVTDKVFDMKNVSKGKILSATIGVLITAISLSAAAGDTKTPEHMGEGNSSHQAMTEQQSSARVNSRYSDEKMKNAWLEGKLEVALLLNRHLNNFTIDNTVVAGKARLEGTVESKIDRELAEQIALSIDGIDKVDNRLEVSPEKSRTAREATPVDRSLSQKIDDMTATASVKTKLLANSSTHGLAINVETVNNDVLLQGEVKTDEEKQLAGKIAENSDGVGKVRNMIKVKQ